MYSRLNAPQKNENRLVISQVRKRFSDAMFGGLLANFSDDFVVTHPMGYLFRNFNYYIIIQKMPVPQ